MTNDYVTVPREPTQGMLDAMWKADASLGVAGMYEAALSAAPPAASVRARELDAAIEALEKAAADFALDATDDDTNNLQDAGCRLQNARDELRTLLAPAVDERAASSEPEMCPNCVTPWKCNGPHEFPAASSEAAKVDGIHTPATCRHPHCNCEHGCVADPAPTTADAGVTEAMVETFEAKFLECARTRPDSTLRDDIRAALVAALGAREGK